ncbi:MAG: hypothetical protein WCY19_05660 [Candidatus Gastranaerophilaceae bacterium]
MKRNLRVLQINGLRGLFLTLFIISCIIAGFIVFPAFLTMNVWNYLAVKTGSFPSISFGGGALLWAIITFSIYVFNKRKFIVSFNAQQELTEDEVREVVSKIKAQAIQHQILLPRDFNIKKEDKEEIEQENGKR